MKILCSDSGQNRNGEMFLIVELRCIKGNVSLAGMDSGDCYKDQRTLPGRVSNNQAEVFSQMRQDGHTLNFSIEVWD